MTIIRSPARQNPVLIFLPSFLKSNTQDVLQDNLLCAVEIKTQGHWRGECTRYLTLQVFFALRRYHNTSRNSSCV